MTAYSAQQYEQNYPQGIGDYFWNLARNHVIADTLRAAGLTDQPMLEVGCSTGVVLRYLRARGMDCQGCELGLPPVAPEVMDHVHLGVDACDLPEDLRNRITVLLLCDVIEHVPEPEVFLGRLRGAFPNARHLLVTVPARREIWSNYDDYFGHFRRYDRPLLDRELAAAGWAPSTRRYFFHALYAVMAVLNLLGVKRGVDQSAPSRPGLHRLMAAMCRWEARLLPAALIGSSLIAVAQRR